MPATFPGPRIIGIERPTALRAPKIEPVHVIGQPISASGAMHAGMLPTIDSGEA